MSFKIQLDNWTNSNLKSLEFIHSRANESLKYTVDIKDAITKRAFTFLSILIPILSLFIGILLSPFKPQIPIEKTFLFVAIISCFMLLISILILIFLIFPKGFYYLGREPKRIAFADVIQEKEDTVEDEPYIGLLLSEIEHLQTKIDFNNKVNYNRLKLLKLVIYIVSMSLTLVLVILLLTSNLTFSLKDLTVYLV